MAKFILRFSKKVSVDEIDGLCDWRQAYDLYREYEALWDSVFMNT